MNNENKPPEQTNKKEKLDLDDTIEEIKQPYRNYSRRLL